MHRLLGLLPIMVSLLILGGCSGGQPCETDADCPDGSQCLEGSCRRLNTCQSDADCSGATPVCDLETGECVACVPDCLGRCCGDDGCGGTCENECFLTGQTCDMLECLCQGDCTPYCQGMECGPDRCGGDCLPGCPEDQHCGQDGKCVACAPDCQDCQCGPDGCGGTCPPGCPDGETCEADGQCSGCQPDCQDRECGPDGCGGTCPPGCGTSQTCDPDGQCIACQPDCVGRECGPDGCGGTCPFGCPAWESCDSQGQCIDCQADCQGKDCGPNGCGGVCGECQPGWTCTQAGTCHQDDVDCNETSITARGAFKNQVSDLTFNQAQTWLSHKRDVDDWEDGCIALVDISLSFTGGCQLHILAGQRFTQNGGLEIQSVQFSADSFCPGFPDSTEGIYTDLGGMELSEVALGVPDVPGDNVAESCVVTSLTIRMQGELMRSDGEALEINDSELVVSGGHISNGDTSLSCPCQPDCQGLQCGPDGCGGSCGSCPNGQACNDGVCACQPDCYGKECGPDGCGGSCGSCPTGQACQEGVCACQPDCIGRQCGPDGCSGTCGTCPTGQSCTNGQCDCVPSCSGKECGDDGCGGSCGTCPTGETCLDFECTDSPQFECLGADSPSFHDCLGISYVGCCDSGRVLWCDNTELYCIQCTADSPCGWDLEDSYYNCAGDGADPSGEYPINCP